ncbi:hypothetical protein GUJ93_ZPchr0010g9064 [Zizania palustris]|uniref:ENT domain-containing protein n=2 Tax=Zizania palustris TaxID=103762 RepID=A0A8J5WAN1_ZIZPA|nr:hypothetical protein GUJ93_ZPchr0010g9064 [Zizania palustris]
MNYGAVDSSSGTDDDLPPSYHNRGVRGSGRVSGNGRDIGGTVPYTRTQPQADMETKIHQLEQDAYCSVLRAFKAQSDAISWEKESLITELRKELRVSDKEHRELLNRVNGDDIIRSIREWRESKGGLQTNMVNDAQRSHDPMPSPTISARKRQKTAQSILSASVPAQSPAVHSQPLSVPMQPLSSTAKKVAPPGTKGKKTKSGQKIPGASAVKTMSSAGPSGRGPIMNKNSSGCGLPTEPVSVDPLIGRKVMTRWPDDNSFYEAVITDYDPQKGRYALVYDINTSDETWEWVDFKEIAPEDIRWEGGDPGIIQQGRGAAAHGSKKSNNRSGPMSGAGRGRGPPKNTSRKDFPPSQNGVGKKSSDCIEILHTETLIKEVERIFSASNPDPLDMEKAKKVLKDHEQSLIDAIARLAEASDGESDERAQPLQNNRGWTNHHGGNHANDRGIDAL